MNQLYFWKDWQTPYKQLYWGLFIIFVTAIIFLLTAWAIGVDMTFPWETYAQGDTIKITIDTIKSGPFQLPFVIDSYLLTESFQGGFLSIFNWPTYVLIGILGSVFTLSITCVTALKKFWYLVGMGLVIVFLMSLQLENLLLFGKVDKVALICVFVLYLPLSYYYQSINKNVMFTTRLLTFSLITIGVGLLIYFASEVQYPFIYLATYGYLAPVIISMLFILMVGHQILSGFIFLITVNNSSFSKNSLPHFLVITSIYLLNLLIVVLNEIQFLYWEFINIHPFVLLLVSSLIGLFLYSHREDTYKHIYKFYPIGGFVYMMLGSVCFFTIGFYSFSANDAIIEVFEDLILYAHLGYGFIFLIYILANFMNPLGKNMQVFKVLYKPQNMPYFTYRFAGTIVVVGFLLASNYNIPVFHTMASYYNGVADLHLRLDEPKIAEVYYKKAKSLDYGNHRANYVLGAIARNEKDNAKATYHFSEAMRKRPTPQSYVNISNIYLEDGKFFDGLFTIRNGANKFPDNNRVKINLGLLYEKANEADSAYLIFSAARNRSVTEQSSNVNILSLINKGDYLYDLDSIIDEYEVKDHGAMISNGFALHNANQQYWDKQVTIDTILNLVTGHTLYNQSINSLFGLDSGYLSSMQQYALTSKNIAFKEQLLMATAIGYYHHQQVEDAFRLMDQLANAYPVKSGYYFYLLGLWSLDQEAPLLAVDFFEKSAKREYSKAKLALAIATMGAGKEDQTKFLWDELSVSIDPIERQMAEKALAMLNSSELLQMNDSEKYWYWKFNVSKENEILTQQVVDVIVDENYKTKIYTDLSQHYLNTGDTTKFFYSMNRTVNVSTPLLANEWSWLSMSKADLSNDLGNQNMKLNDSSSRYENLMMNYYDAKKAFQQQDSIAAKKLFLTASANPFFERGVIGKASYLNSMGEEMEAYNTILNALEINPYAINLRKEYILQCARMDFDRYAEHALEALQPLVSSQQHHEFRKQYEYLLKATQDLSEYFDD